MPAEPPVSELFDFVLSKLETESVTKRARICRALAGSIGDESYARSLLALADSLEAIERAHNQLLLDFRRRNS